MAATEELLLDDIDGAARGERLDGGGWMMTWSRMRSEENPSGGLAG